MLSAYKPGHLANLVLPVHHLLVSGWPPIQTWPQSCRRALLAHKLVPTVNELRVTRLLRSSQEALHLNNVVDTTEGKEIQKKTAAFGTSSTEAFGSVLDSLRLFESVAFADCAT
jgi:hypothetical protein